MVWGVPGAAAGRHTRLLGGGGGEGDDSGRLLKDLGAVRWFGLWRPSLLRGGPSLRPAECLVLTVPGIICPSAASTSNYYSAQLCHDDDREGDHNNAQGNFNTSCDDESYNYHHYNHSKVFDDS